MSGKSKRRKKSGKQNHSLEKIVLLTAILELVNAIVDLIDNLTS